MDIAGLGYEIDSSQTRTAAKDLDRMNAAAAKAERGAKSLKSASRDLLRDEGGRFMSAAKSAEKYGSEIEQLRMKYNPLYAASKQFEAQQGELQRALALGAISVTQYDRALETLQGGMMRAGGAAGVYGKQMTQANMHTANVFAQMNDIGVMMASGQNPFILAIQQGTQLNQVWGQMGGNARSIGSALSGAFASMLNPVSLLTIAVIAGGASLVQWGMSALGAGESAKTFDDALGGVETSLSDINNQAKLLSEEGLKGLVEKYGEINTGVAQFINLQTEAMKREAIDGMAAAMAALTDEQSSFLSSGTWADLADLFSVNAIEANKMAVALRDAQSARTFDDQLSALTSLRSQIISATGGIGKMTDAQFQFYLKVADSEEKARQLANAAPKVGWMSDAISETNMLIGRLTVAYNAANSLRVTAAAASGTAPVLPGVHGQEGGEGSIRIPVIPSSGVDGSGGGGGSADPYAENLNRLIESLRTEKETVDAWYNENVAILNDRRSQEILGEQSHKDAMLDLERQYQEKKKGIQGVYEKFTLDSAGNLFGELYSLSGSSFDGLLRMQKSFGAASALVSTYTAAAQVLADPELPFFAKFAAVAKTVAAGLGLVSAIKGGGSGGGGGGASATTSATAQQRAEPERVTRVELQGEDWLVKLADSMLTQIYDASKNGRVIIAR